MHLAAIHYNVNYQEVHLIYLTWQLQFHSRLLWNCSSHDKKSFSSLFFVQSGLLLRSRSKWVSFCVTLYSGLTVFKTCFRRSCHMLFGFYQVILRTAEVWTFCSVISSRFFLVHISSTAKIKPYFGRSEGLLQANAFILPTLFMWDSDNGFCLASLVPRGQTIPSVYWPLPPPPTSSRTFSTTSYCFLLPRIFFPLMPLTLEPFAPQWQYLHRSPG